MVFAPYSLEVTRRLIALDDALDKGASLTTAFRPAQDGQPERLDLIAGSAVFSFPRSVGIALVGQLVLTGFDKLADQINAVLPAPPAEPPPPTVDEIAEDIRGAIDPKGDQKAKLEALDRVREEILKGSDAGDVKAEAGVRGSIAYDV